MVRSARLMNCVSFRKSGIGASACARRSPDLPVADHLRGREHEHWLASLPCHHGLGDAPGRGEPVGGAEHDHTPALAQAPPKRLLPPRASMNAVVRVRIQEQRLIALVAQRFPEGLGPSFFL